MLAFPNNRTATILELKILFIATTQHCFCDKTLHFHTLLLSSLQVALGCPACEWEQLQVSVSRALMQVPKHLKQPQGFIEAALTLGTVAGRQGRGIKSAIVHRLQVQDRAREDIRYLNHLYG